VAETKEILMSLRRVITLLVPVFFCALALPARATAQVPAQAPAPGAQAQAPAARGTERVVIIDMQGAVTGCNEGQRDFEALGKKFEPRRTELQRLNTELDGLKSQLATQGPTMAPAARDGLTKSIETRTKTLQRTAEDSNNEFQQQQNEIAQRILQKLAPVLKKYADDHGYGLVLDASMPWPQGPVVIAAPALDITRAVVDAYNTQSAVPPPPKK
jgi:outer membrane protein